MYIDLIESATENIFIVKDGKVLILKSMTRKHTRRRGTQWEKQQQAGTNRKKGRMAKRRRTRRS